MSVPTWARARARARAVVRRAAVLATIATGLSACTPRRELRPEPVRDPVASAWAVTLDSARAQIASGRATRADSMLTAFRARHVGASQSAEALYWRALARSDPATPAGGVRPAIADLDAYRATAAPEHLAEAVVLRRTLVELDSARAVTAVVERPTAVAGSRAGLVPRDSLRVRDEELQRARADAAAAKAELDRVRRRLAAPGRRP